ncbi:CapA family protein [Spirulina sp. CS-785/01]|uniref:CapA family protein n=1 Tax=Spirulina sp. CS-785/01 TaxID=3021716 RepID=UPI00232D397C|nr:CapA family protein [Spirulina sp. CS-785/01]MDB9312396.1 CapA family protein [Spirulina sp. CS-785/01]
MNLSLMGDICLIQQDTVLNDIYASVAIGNLETIVAEEGNIKRKKAGPNMSGCADKLSLLKSHFPSLFLTLANNHSMDYGEDNLLNTIQQCEQLSFHCIGAGANLNTAKAPIFFENDGIKFGILARCETQFGIASQQKGGVAALDAYLYQEIEKLKKECDIVIVSIHASAEMCSWPSPKWQDFLRSLIDNGANIIHGHHSHIPQGYEKYNDGWIFYGLGNFLVKPSIWKKYPNALWSIVPNITVENNTLSCDIKTIVIEEKNNTVLVRFSDPEEHKKHLDYLEKCNHPLQDRLLLEGLWQEASVRMYNHWYASYLDFGRSKRKAKLLNIIRHYLGTIKRQITNSPSQHKLLLWYHLFACESHRDVIATALGVLSGELEDLRTEKSRCLVEQMMPWFS